MRYRQGEMDLGVMSLTSGLGLATFGSAVCLLRDPAVRDESVRDRSRRADARVAVAARTFELLAGKAVGIGLIAAGPALVVMLFALGALPWWAAGAVAEPAACARRDATLLAAPGAAALSAIFPRTVDLNSIGRGSNPHSLANLLGLLLFAAAGLPGVLHRLRDGQPR